jgi:hypothetical protein
MEDVGIFYGHLVHFTVFCYILWTFGIARGNLVYLSQFRYFVRRKSGKPDLEMFLYAVNLRTTVPEVCTLYY